jgi:hypothetical protein
MKFAIANGRKASRRLIFWRILTVMLFAYVLMAYPAPKPVMAGPALGPTPEDQLRYLHLNGYRFDPLERMPAFPPGLSYAGDQGEKGAYHIVQLQGPVTEEMKTALRATGARILGYVPSNAFIVAADSQILRRARGVASVRWAGPFEPAYKYSPTLSLSYDEQVERSLQSVEESPDAPVRRPVDTSRWITVHIVPMERSRLDEVRSAVSELGGRNLGISEYGSGLVRAEVPRSALEAIARQPGVAWIEREFPIFPANDFARWVIQSNDPVTLAAPIHEHGIHGEGQSVTVADLGLDWEHAAFRDSAYPLGPDPNHRKVTDYYIPPAPCAEGEPNWTECGDNEDTPDCERGSGNPLIEHGTHVAGSVAGDDGLPGAYDGSTGSPGVEPHDGQAFAAKIRIQDISRVNQKITPPMDYRVLFSAAVNPARYPVGTNTDDFAWIHTNSWGNKGTHVYNSDAARIDEFAWSHPKFLMLFAAGNSGSGPISLYAEPTAKNVITVGMGDGRTGPDNVANMSSRGPTTASFGGRLKPDVMAPGSVWSPKGCDDSTRCCTPDQIDTGACPVCAPDGYPNRYDLLDGTSMATPQVAGAAALVRQYFIDGWYPTGIANAANRIVPSAALMKAALINGAVEMHGGGSHNDPTNYYPNNDQGWGRILLDNSLYFNGDHLHLQASDQTSGLVTSATRTYSFPVTASDVPFEATLVWTDHGADVETSGNLINDLDLTVTSPSGTAYHGNQFFGPPGGQPVIDGGFEQGTTYWTLGIDECDMGGASINTDPTMSRGGMGQSLLIESRVFGGLSTCGSATQVVSGLTIGRTYQIGGFYRTANVTTQQFSVLLDGVSIKTLGGAAAAYTSFGPVSFTATATSHAIGLRFVTSGTDWKTYYFDDVSISFTGESQPNATGRDNVNNVEGVLVLQPETGPWAITVSGYNVPEGPQPYALVVTGANDVAGGLADGGFEQGTAFWPVSTPCDINGAVFTGSPVRSGAKSLQIDARVLGGVSTCGKATQILSGLVIGHTYELRGYYRTNSSVTNQKFKVMVDANVVATLGSSSPSAFTAFGPVAFTATATSHAVALYFQATGSPVKTYYFDDLTWQ